MFFGIILYVLLFLGTIRSNIQETCLKLPKERENLEITLQSLYDNECYREVVSLLDKERVFRLKSYSSKSYLLFSVSLFSINQYKLAEELLLEALQLFPDDETVLVNLIEVKLSSFATDTQYYKDLLYNITGWKPLSSRYDLLDWNNLEWIKHEIEDRQLRCVANESECVHIQHDLASWMYTDISGFEKRVIIERSSKLTRRDAMVKSLAKDSLKFSKLEKLRLGIILVSLGTSPVTSLLNGFIRSYDRSRIDLFLFVLRRDQKSRYEHYFHQQLDNIKYLDGLSFLESALVIKSMNIHILIETSGWSMISGIPILEHRPSPVQIAFLGDAYTTGDDFIDFFVSDQISIPPELSSHFTEKLILLPVNHLINDYRNIHKKVLTHAHRYRRYSLRSQLVESVQMFENQHNEQSDLLGLQYSSMVFGIFSNARKFDPMMWQVWMNIMRQSVESTAIFQLPWKTWNNSKYQAKFYGIMHSKRMFNLPVMFERNHLLVKSSIDLLLDPLKKNGHVTNLDATYSCIPILGFSSMNEVPSRSAESLSFYSNQAGETLSFSMKEYEDLAVELASKGNKKLFDIRKSLYKLRSSSPVFNSSTWQSSFIRLMHAAVEIKLLLPSVKMHIFAPMV